MSGVKFEKNSQIYPKLRDKKYHSNSNIKKDILHDSRYRINLLQFREIVKFLYANNNKRIANENMNLKYRWFLRRKNK